MMLRGYQLKGYEFYAIQYLDFFPFIIIANLPHHVTMRIYVAMDCVLVVTGTMVLRSMMMKNTAARHSRVSLFNFQNLKFTLRKHTMNEFSKNEIIEGFLNI
jgi:hypothetical protein